MARPTASIDTGKTISMAAYYTIRPATKEHKKHKI
jgi:hypothetical protein